MLSSSPHSSDDDDNNDGNNHDEKSDITTAATAASSATATASLTINDDQQYKDNLNSIDFYELLINIKYSIKIFKNIKKKHSSPVYIYYKINN